MSTHKGPKQETFLFICSGGQKESKDEAWDSFRKEAAYHFKFINGYKYWRLTPILAESLDFADNSKLYQVNARVIASIEPILTMEEAKIEGPYPEDKDPFEGITGFALS